MQASGTTKLLEMWPAPVVEAVASVLGDSEHGLTGREIDALLVQVRVPQVEGSSKRVRLTHSLLARQTRDGAANCLVAFINQAMAPVAYTTRPQVFSRRRDDLNEVLVHVGLRVNAQGKVARGPAAATLDEAARHAGSLRSELRRRGSHCEGLRYCTTEILARDAFHAALEAVKSLTDRLRHLTGERFDGARLVDGPAARPRGAGGDQRWRHSDRAGRAEGLRVPGQGTDQHVPQPHCPRPADQPHRHRRP